MPRQHPSRLAVPFDTSAMQFVIDSLFNPEQVVAIVEQLQSNQDDWRAGAETAGWHARAVKNNHQLDRSSALHHQLATAVQQQLRAHPLVQAAAFPRQIHGILFSRTGIGEGYRRHVDNAWMTDGRSDLSFTIWLSDPTSYEGGELTLETGDGERSYRLPAGHCLVYPSTLLHCVEPVRSGQRLVAVGWIESKIRHTDQRELLFELDTARRALFARSGKDEIFDLVTKSYTNLLRRWER